MIEVILSFLAAGGLLALGWLLFGRLLAPVGGADGGRVCAVVPAVGGGETMEHDVSGLLWLRGGGLARFTIVIADAGLNEAGRAVADALVEREPGLVLCPMEALSDCLRGL